MHSAGDTFDVMPTSTVPRMDAFSVNHALDEGLRYRRLGGDDECPLKTMRC